MRLHEQVIELKSQKALAIDAINDFYRLLNCAKFKNTETELKNWISTADVNAQLRIILNALVD